MGVARIACAITMAAGVNSHSRKPTGRSATAQVEDQSDNDRRQAEKGVHHHDQQPPSPNGKMARAVPAAG